MDINYELYKVFYHVATTLEFFGSCRTSLFISQSAVSQSIKALERKLRSDSFLSAAPKRVQPHSGRRTPSAPCGTSYESDSPWGNPAFRSF